LSIWIFIWVIFAAVMIFVTGWSTFILIKQKQAWKKFAADKGINFRSGKFFSPCEMEGEIEGFRVSFFTGEQQNPDVRKNRQLTIVEITDMEPYVDGIACGSNEMKEFIDMLDGLSLHKIDHEKWNKNNVLASRNKKSVEAYLTDKRIKLISEFLAFPKSDVIIIFNENQAVYRFETANPLTETGMISEMLKKLFARIEKLRPTEDEIKNFKALQTTKKEITPSAE